MGYRIKELREEARLTQEQLSEKSGVSRVTIALIESKSDYATTTRTLVKIANALGTTVDALFFTPSVQPTEQYSKAEV